MLVAVYRTIILYIFILICYRIMGKKEVGELNIIDLIVSFSIAELASISIEEIDRSIFYSILPITVLVILEIILSYIGMKSESFRSLTDGKPEVIVSDGKINLGLMKKLRYTIDDLLTQVRSKNITNLKDVKYAVLETDGTLSVFSKSDYPMPLIIDGKPDITTLKSINKSRYWLDELLKERNIKLEDIFYAFYSNGHTYIITKDDTL